MDRSFALCKHDSEFESILLNRALLFVTEAYNPALTLIIKHDLTSYPNWQSALQGLLPGAHCGPSWVGLQLDSSGVM